MDNKTALENKLHALKIPGRVAAVSDNGFFNIYHVVFNDDITLNRIKARRDDIGLFLGGPVEIETDAGAVMIKAQKKDRDAVSINNYLSDILKGVDGLEIPLIIGQNEDGTRLYYDLCAMPHLLIGGATGSGKSVYMHDCILSVMSSRKSAIILIDIKRVEFSIYENISHLCTPVCYTTRDALETLKKVNAVMNNRYKTLQDNNARNIKEYTDAGGKMQYITIFIDELADLLLTDKRIETQLIKIAQLGRAAGIHLITATQRPDSKILSGLIRANIPSRVCFAVQKATDSRIILDQSGGENLRGRGDGLFLPIGSKTPRRFQAPYITNDDILKLIT